MQSTPCAADAIDPGAGSDEGVAARARHDLEVPRARTVPTDPFPLRFY